MTDDSDAAEKRAWMKAALGVSIPPPGDPEPRGDAPPGAAARGTRAPTMAAADPDTPFSKAARDPRIWTQRVGTALQAGSRDGPPPPVTPSTPIGPKTTIRDRAGKKIEVVTGKDGRVALTTEPPPVQEITFSGGGGKGAALPGAVRALEETGMLKDVKCFHGASVGSMTAAVLAAGMSAETFTRVANDTKMGPLVKGGDILPLNVDGDGLEGFVRQQIGTSVHDKIAEFLKTENGIDEATLGTVRAIDGKIDRGGGVTFGELRTLSKIVPGIKDLVISGTMMGDDSAAPGKIEKGKPQLAIFSADTEPDLDIARAVHASAALPPVFKPVNIRMSSGVTARFQDGGIMNNAPTSDLIGAERALDPIPAGGKMTFVFEAEVSAEILKGEATPARKRVSDLVTGAPMSVAEYAQNRALADRPEDIVMVPLKFKGPWYKRTDFSGFIGGTVNFDMPKEDKVKLQSLTETATLAHIKNRELPQTRDFTSAGEMLSSLGRADLEAMADGDVPGAKDEVKFRDEVAKSIAALETLAAGAKPEALARGPLQQALKALDGLAQGEANRQAYIGRELNRSGKLDPLLDLAKASGVKGPPILQAGVAVADALAAKSHAQTILREVVYPKMVTENPKGVGGTVLRQVDTLLRSAKTPKDVNDALTIAIKHFAKKSDFANRHGHHAFAAELQTYLMKVT
jgi:exoenzyme U